MGEEIHSMDKKILIFLFAMLMLIPMASAGLLDAKEYNPITKEITIKNKFLGIPTTVYAIYKLTSNTDYCISHCSAEGVANLKFDGLLFESKRFENLNKNNINIKNSQFYISTKTRQETVEIPDYEQICKIILSENDTKPYEECHSEKIGMHNETKIIKIWDKYNYEFLESGIYDWKIEGEKEMTQSVDWIANANGIDLSEWAVWTSSMSIGLKGYWTLNETSGAIAKDSLGLINGSIENAVINQAGKIDASYDFQNNAVINWSDQSWIAGITQLSFSYWMNLDACVNDGIFGQAENSDASFSTYCTATNTLNFVAYKTWTDTASTISTIATGSWIHVVGTYNTTRLNLWLNGTLVGSDTTSLPTSLFDSTSHLLAGRYYSNLYYMDGKLDEIAIWNRTLTDSEISDLYNNGAGISYISTLPSVTIINSYPPTGANATGNTIGIGCNATGMGATNISYIRLKVYNSSNSISYIQDFILDNSSNSYNATTITSALSDSIYNWSCNGQGNDLTTAYSNNWTFTIDTTAPVLTINNPNSTSILLRQNNLPFNFTITEAISFIDSCWYNLNNGANKSLNNLCHLNKTLTSSDLYNVTYNGRQNLYFFGNDTFNNNRNTSVSWYVYNYSHTADGLTAGEGSYVTFNLTLDGSSINAEYSGNNATLVFNSISYIPNIIDRTNSGYTYFEKTLAIPSETGNATGKSINYNWTYQIRNSTATLLSGTTDTKALAIYNVSITDCNDVSGRIILNMSLKDEGTNAFVNITSPNVATIEIDLDITSLINSTQIWNFHKKWENNNSVAVCVPNELLNNTNYKIDFTVGYDATGKVREFFYMDNGTLDNTDYFNSYTDNTIDLMDLASADSTTFLFSFTDADGLEIDDALVHTFRKYIGEGLFREVERSKQDNNGQTHVHLVEEDVIYYFMVTQYGNIIFTSDQYNAKCLSTPCEITLSASATDIDWSIIDNEGGKYSITSDKSTRIVTLDFNLDASSLVNMSIYKYNGANATLINTTSLTAMAGSIPLHVPIVYGNDTFFAVIYNNNTFVKSAWIDLTESGKDYFGTTGAILSGLVVLSMMLMAVSEGVGFIIFTVLALIVVTAMKLVNLNALALISIICAGGIIMWKLINRRNKPN